jgi:hypothetical protein
MTKMVPFLIKDGLLDLGATCLLKGQELGAPVRGQLMTGQNPASSGPTAQLFIETLTA